MNTKLFSAVVAAVGLGWGASVLAAPVIGIAPSGDGATFFYSSLWTDVTDTGVDQGVFTEGETHTFTSQTVVGSTSLNGAINTPTGLNCLTTGCFEISKEVKIQDLLDSIITNGTTTTFHFTNTVQTDGVTDLAIYLDTLGDGTQAVRAGPTGAECYGAGSGCPTDDGVLILTAHIIANDSTFTATSPGTGQGSFTLTFAIDFFNPSYVDVSNLAVDGGTGLPLFSDIITGTLVQPADEAHLGYPPPTHMWDGTGVAGNQLFKVDSSETFGAAAVPEPGSLALFGLALGVMGWASRRSKL